jgi:hypothetical protein
LRDGRLRLQTVFRSPNGENIDVYVGPDHPPGLNHWVISDLGETFDILSDLHVKPLSTKKRKQFVDDICRAYDVEQRQGELYVPFDPNDVDAIPRTVIQLVQALTRISDLALTQRFRAQSSFREDFEEFVSQMNLNYRNDVLITGRYNRPVRLDYVVQGARARHGVITLSTANSNAAQNLSRDAFARWYDLADVGRVAENPSNIEDRITIYDSNNDAFREDDLLRLAEVSSVLGFPAQSQDIEAVLAA